MQPVKVDQAERILDAAAELFARHGVNPVGMGEVARAAGCSRATLYRYFEDRRALHLAFVRREARRIGVRVATETAPLSDPGERLTAAVLVAVRLVREVPALLAWFGAADAATTAGLAQSDEVGDGVLAEEVWHDPLRVAVPAEHPLAARTRIPLDELLRYPLVMCDPQACEGHARQVARVLRAVDREPLVVEQVASFDLMMALVSAGFALGLAGASQLAASREQGVMARPLAGRSPVLTTYLLRLDREPSEPLARFIERVASIESPGDGAHAVTANSAGPEEPEP